MERFIKFKEKVSLKDLTKILTNPSIILLRESQTTETIQIQLLQELTDRDIKRAFTPLQVDRIYHEFPYPLKHKSIAGMPNFLPFRYLRKILNF